MVRSESETIAQGLCMGMRSNSAVLTGGIRPISLLLHRLQQTQVSSPLVTHCEVRVFTFCINHALEEPRGCDGERETEAL